MLSEKCYRKAIFLLDETARVGYNTRVLGTRRKTGSWVQKGPFHRVVGLPLVFGSGGDFFQGESWNLEVCEGVVCTTRADIFYSQ